MLVFAGETVSDILQLKSRKPCGGPDDHTTPTDTVASGRSGAEVALATE
jgi:hypothetical protein